MPDPEDFKVGELNNRVLNVSADLPDIRDRIYQPSLVDLKLSMMPPSPSESPILDQGNEGSCTGVALAAAINLQNNLRQAQLNSQSVFAKLPAMVSRRMLYEMAKKHDQWPGDDYEGSSIRGALKGFFNHGVCDEQLATYTPTPGQSNWFLTKEQAKDARKVGLGAYYRLRPNIIDYHAALNETGVVYISAKIHRGWHNPKQGIINKSNIHEGGHAFIIVGYNENGFLIQNSWGSQWGGYSGHGGIAEWSYADWAENIMDAWVLRLAVPTPDHFDLTHTPQSTAASTAFSEKSTGPAPTRNEILGHFISIDDGEFKDSGRYWTNEDAIVETCNVIKADEQKPSPDYKHLMFYMHGGLVKPRVSARRIRRMKEAFKRNGIYPIHFIWDTGLTEEFFDIIFKSSKKTESRVNSGFGWWDNLQEAVVRLPGRALWGEMKRDAAKAFKSNADGTKAMKLLLTANEERKKPLKVHFVAHSAGAVLLGEFLKAKNSIAKDHTSYEN